MEIKLQCNKDELKSILKECFLDAIKEIKKMQEENKLSDRMLLIEVCELTHYSTAAIRHFVTKGTIPFEKYGKRLVFSRRKILEWMNNKFKT
jgi:hypothetical protein